MNVQIYKIMSKSEENIEQSISELDVMIASHEDAELYYQRGRLKWKAGRQTEAMSDYSKAVALDPSSPAAVALELARDVMAFYHKDRYNP